MQESSRGQVLIIKHVLCVMPGNKHNKMPCINSNSNTSHTLKFPDKYTAAGNKLEGDWGEIVALGAEISP